MSEEKWTQGPWRAKREGQSIFIDASIGNGTAQEVAVCQPTHNWEHQGYNAHLIAAAPELYEALEVFAACADELDATRETEMTPDDEWAKFRLLASDYRKARAAIAKAKGETQ